VVDVGPEEVTAAMLVWQLAPRLLGPTVDYLGEGLLNSTKAAANLSRIFVKALGKLGQSANEPGTVPPRVLKVILDEGPFCDDELGAEYFAGLLASSRTPGGKDEEGLSLLATVSRLPTTALLLHFGAYRALYEARGVPEAPLYAVKLMDLISQQRLLDWAEEVEQTATGTHSEMLEATVNRLIPLLFTRLQAAIVNLQREHLVDDVSATMHPARYEASVADRSLGATRFVFSPTGLGYLLFARLHGHRGPIENFVLSTHEDYDPSLPETSLERLTQTEADRYLQSLVE
jgi:hypothetical protein